MFIKTKGFLTGKHLDFLSDFVEYFVLIIKTMKIYLSCEGLEKENAEQLINDVVWVNASDNDLESIESFKYDILPEISQSCSIDLSDYFIELRKEIDTFIDEVEQNSPKHQYSRRSKSAKYK